jgi:hypothetical protein
MERIRNGNRLDIPTITYIFVDIYLEPAGAFRGLRGRTVVPAKMGAASPLSLEMRVDLRSACDGAVGMTKDDKQ